MRGASLRGLAFVGIFLLLAHAVGALGNALAPVDGNLRWREPEGQRNRRLRDAEALASAEALALGNSHSAAIDWPALGREGLSLDRPGGDLFETRRYAAYWQPRMPAAELALVVLPYFAFRYDNAADPETYMNRVAFYEALPGWQPLPGDWRRFALGRLAPILPVRRLARGEDWRRVFVAAVSATRGGAEDAESLEGACPTRPPAEMLAHAEQRAGRYARHVEVMTRARPDLPEAAEAELLALVSELRSAGLRVLLYTPPYTEAYTQAFEGFAPEVLADMRQRARRVSEASGAAWVDRSADPEIAGDTRLFRDSDHLNPCGAARFSADLAELLADER